MLFCCLVCFGGGRRRRRRSAGWSPVWFTSCATKTQTATSGCWSLRGGILDRCVRRILRMSFFIYILVARLVYSGLQDWWAAHVLYGRSGNPFYCCCGRWLQTSTDSFTSERRRTVSRRDDSSCSPEVCRNNVDLHRCWRRRSCMEIVPLF